MPAEKKTVYVVIGTCGEYSDRTEWCVAVLTTEDLAKKYVIKATACAPKWIVDYDEREAVKNPYDPDMETDCTGTSYYYSPAPMLDAIPAVQS